MSGGRRAAAAALALVVLVAFLVSLTRDGARDPANEVPDPHPREAAAAASRAPRARARSDEGGALSASPSPERSLYVLDTSREPLSASAAGEERVLRPEESPTGPGVPDTKSVRARFVTSAGAAKGISLEGAVSDDDGRIAFRVARSYRGFLIAHHPDGTPFRVSIPQDDASEADLGEVAVLLPGAIGGVVVDEMDRPVARASVALLSADLDCRTVGTATTDEQGRFAIERVGHGRHEVVVRATAPADVEAPEFGGRVQGLVAGAQDVRVVARRMFAVVLRLKDENGKDPVSGPWIASELHRSGEPLDVRLHELRHRVSEVTWLVDRPGTYDVEVRMFDTALHQRYGGVVGVELRADRENAVDVVMVLR